MTDVFEQLRQLENKNKDIDIDLYIYYNLNTGEIIHVRNILIIDDDITYPYIKVKKTDFDDNFNILDYLVVNIDNFPKLIKHLGLLNQLDDVIHRIMKNTIFNSNINYYEDFVYDLLVEQDYVKREFRFRFNKNLRKIYQSEIFKSKTINLYLTDVNDPHILYKAFNLNLFDISQYEWYTISFDQDMSLDYDFYTSRYFPKYLNLVIRENNHE